MLLSSHVQCVQKRIKLTRGLTTEHRQQLLVLTERYQLCINDISLVWAEDIGLIKLTDESGIFGVHSVDKVHVMLTDSLRVNKTVVETYTRKQTV